MVGATVVDGATVVEEEPAALAGSLFACWIAILAALTSAW